MIKQRPYNDYSTAIHKEGYIFIVSFAVITFLIGSFSTTLGWIGFIATLWCIYFFRNPDRFVPTGDNLVVSPADGIIHNITETSPPAELGFEEANMIRISIFLSIFNVHVNRIPVSGKILTLNYNPGKFFNASLDKASTHNERQSVVLQTDSGQKIAFVQIAGLIARRIVCDLEEEEHVEKGERYGIIRFGSRMDIYLPIQSTILVGVGQTAIGGETIIADFALKKTAEPQFEKK